MLARNILETIGLHQELCIQRYKVQMANMKSGEVAWPTRLCDS